MAPFLRAKQLKQLYLNDWLEVPGFLSDNLCEKLREDLKKLRNDHSFEVASIGHDGNQIQDESVPFRDIRRSESCFIGKFPQRSGSKTNQLPTSESREELYTILNDLREDLEASFNETVPPLDSELLELMYVYYPNGGYYRRHFDSEQDSECISSIREWSFVLYLNEEWNQRQGGCLRLHRDDGASGGLPNYIDIEPRLGTLVIFRSKNMPHEVLDTRADRFAIVGWFLSSTNNGPSLDVRISSSRPKDVGINPKTLEALVRLRDAVPSLASRLDQPATNEQSGMIWDDVGATPSLSQEAKAKLADINERGYWSKICSFDDNGFITTLSLGGIRLHRTSPLDILDLSFYQIKVLDVAGTCISVDILSDLISKCASLKQLYLGGNGLGDKGIRKLTSNNIENIQKLRSFDVRYNDITSQGATCLAKILKSSDCCLEYLYLEGNDLGCEGACILACTGSLTELFLGQNKIGTIGAKALAEGLLSETSCLRKLFLEGNRIGPEGAIEFRKAIEKLGTKRVLEKLYVDNNGIGKVEFSALGQALNSATMIGDGGIFQE